MVVTPYLISHAITLFHLSISMYIVSSSSRSSWWVSLLSLSLSPHCIFYLQISLQLFFLSPQCPLIFSFSLGQCPSLLRFEPSINLRNKPHSSAVVLCHPSGFIDQTIFSFVGPWSYPWLSHYVFSVLHIGTWARGCWQLWLCPKISAIPVWPWPLIMNPSPPPSPFH